MGRFCDGRIKSKTSSPQESADGRNAVRVLFICAQEARWQIVDKPNHTSVAFEILKLHPCRIFSLVGFSFPVLGRNPCHILANPLGGEFAAGSQLLQGCYECPGRRRQVLVGQVANADIQV